MFRPFSPALQVPTRYGSLFEWLRACLEDPSQTTVLEQLFREMQTKYPEVGEVTAIALAMMRLMPASRTLLTLHYLSGAHLTAKSSHPSSRAYAYRLFRFWVIFCIRYLGCRGIMILIDELENLFSGALYPSFPSRKAAYRTLCFYTACLQPAIILGALTPDSWTKLRSEIDQATLDILKYSTRLPEEDISTFCTTVLTVRPHYLFPLAEPGYREFMGRLVRLHAEARDYPVHQTNHRISMPRISPEMTPRIFSRSVISTLEALWFEELWSQRQYQGKF